MAQPIIFYDLPNILSLEKRSYSANTLRTRFILNYRKIPYKTVWVDYVDVQTVLKELGAPPTGTLADGSTPRYSLPTIYDPNTSKFVADSVEIAKYLDSQYPSDHPLIPAGTEELQTKFAQTAMQHFIPAFHTIGVLTYHTLSDRNKPALNATFQPRIGGPSLGERDLPTEVDMEKIYAGYSSLAASLDEVIQQIEAQLRGVNDLIFVIIVTAAAVHTAGAWTTDAQFARILDQDGHKLRKLYERVRPYTNVDEGERYQVIAAV